MNSSLPNVLTAARLVAVPIIVVLMIADAGAHGPARWWVLAVFLAAAATDFLDGYFARRWKVVSEFGKLADPIADKALVLTTLLMVVIVDGVAWWPLAVLAVREVGITLGRLAVASEAVIPASAGGKLKTTLQLVAVTLFLVPHAPQWLTAAAWWCLVAAVLVAIVTGLDYAAKIRRVRRAARTPLPVEGQENSEPDAAQ